jgi:hypothetical protein
LLAALFDPSPRSKYWSLPCGALALTLTLAFCSVGLGNKDSPRRGRTRGQILGLALLLGTVGTLIGCGGGFLGPFTTPPNSYVVTITGTSGSLHASTTTVVVQ